MSVDWSADRDFFGMTVETKVKLTLMGVHSQMYHGSVDIYTLIAIYTEKFAVKHLNKYISTWNNYASKYYHCVLCKRETEMWSYNVLI